MGFVFVLTCLLIKKYTQMERCAWCNAFVDDLKAEEREMEPCEMSLKHRYGGLGFHMLVKKTETTVEEIYCYNCMWVYTPKTLDTTCGLKGWLLQHNFTGIRTVNIAEVREQARKQRLHQIGHVDVFY